MRTQVVNVGVVVLEAGQEEGWGQGTGRGEEDDGKEGEGREGEERFVCGVSAAIGVTVLGNGP